MMHENIDQEIINPLNYFMDKDEQAVSEPKPRKSARPSGRKPQGIFITATDTGVGKTVCTQVLGVLLKNRGLRIGVIKPVQCGGRDAAYLKKVLHLKESPEEINPFRADEPLSPHLAFQRQKIRFDRQRVLSLYQEIQRRCDYVLVEGAGGLMVPITENYLMIDLVRDLGLDVVVVARPDLGTINHTLLTVCQAQGQGIGVRGILFNQAKKPGRGDHLSEQTNPDIIHRISRIPILGLVPHMSCLDNQTIQKQCSLKIDVRPLMGEFSRPDSRRWAGWDKEYIWHPFTQMKDWLKEDPLIVRRARGHYLEDVNGKKYLDGISSLWVNVHGHGREEIDAAIRQQLNEVSHSTLLGSSNTAAVELAKKLIEIAPRGLKKVFYSDNGSTAVEVAVKMAYQYWQNTGHKSKTKIAHLENAYHGDTLGSVSVGGIGLFHKVFNRLTFKTVRINFPDFYRVPPGKNYPNYTEECLDEMEKIFAHKADEIAALVVEPIVQAAAGILVWPRGVLSRIKSLCEKHNILLIADEVATGFGRTGRMFACNHEKITPDFLCLAKGLSGGYLPLAATLTTRRIFDGFLFPYKAQKTFFHGHTYTGNALGCAAALANIGIFEKEKTLDKLLPKVRYFASRLEAFSALKHVGQVRQKGLMAGIELVRDKASKAPYRWEEKVGVRVCEEARRNGVLLRPLGDVIVLMPPLSIAKNEMDMLLDVTYAGIKEVTEEKRPQRRK